MKKIIIKQRRKYNGISRRKAQADFSELHQAAEVCNEESKLNGMKGNRRLYGDIIAGPMYIVGDNGDGNFCDLTDEQMKTYGNLFAEPEEISDEEVQADSGFFFYSM